MHTKISRGRSHWTGTSYRALGNSRTFRLRAALALALAMLFTIAGPAGAQEGYVNGEPPSQGQRLAERHCASCHGRDGNSANPRYPKLAGQKAAYLYWQLWAFKTGRRASAAMAAVTQPMTDADIASLARYYAAQTPRPDPVTDAELASAGERLFFERPRYGRGPSCAMCHGGGATRMPMMGMMGNRMVRDAPDLAGQHARYLLLQLNAFASGQRPSQPMDRIAASLTEAERQAIAEYLSGIQ